MQSHLQLHAGRAGEILVADESNAVSSERVQFSGAERGLGSVPRGNATTGRRERALMSETREGDGRLFDLGLEAGLGTPLFTACRIRHEPTSLVDLRRFTRQTLGFWGLGAISDDTASVATELAHRLVPEPGFPFGATTGWVSLTILGGPNATLLCVASGTPGNPPSAPHSHSGRILTALTRSWVHATDATWARLPLR
ncbi:hypothetical protein ACFY2K_04065 [Kitasatospora sp. NPDC001309]|uniref:hypothetical protein n=1 Tax=Kitasatospora sp. NPDC001309 TaxID=3364013 RepID=UPI0036A01F65